MESDIVKCDKCNIVINEVLAFVNNKIDVMDEESLVRICDSAFSAKEILGAKKLLFNSLPTSQRMKSRKREGRSHRDLEDVITLLKNTDPELIPIFVARDLQKLPPVTFDHVDVTRLLKDLVLLRSDLKSMQEGYVPLKTFNSLKSEVDNLKQASIVNYFESNVNMKRGAHLINSHSYDSGPMGLEYVSMKSSSQSPQEREFQSASVNTFSNKNVGLPEREEIGSVASNPHLVEFVYNECASKTTNVDTLSQAQVASISCASLCARKSTDVASPLKSTTSPRVNNGSESTVSQESFPTTLNMDCSPITKTFAEVVNVPSHTEKEKPTEEWTLVQKNRLKNKFIGQKGKAIYEPEAKFKAADNKVPLFIYNVDKGTAEDDISEHIFSKTRLRVPIIKINMKSQRGYNAFKISIPRHRLSMFMDENFWPDGIRYRRFVEFRNRDNAGKIISNTRIENVLPPST